ncbi:MAG: hypothetical protein ABH857_05190 [Elusimicrobiota bacterium]
MKIKFKISLIIFLTAVIMRTVFLNAADSAKMPEYMPKQKADEGLEKMRSIVLGYKETFVKLNAPYSKDVLKYCSEELRREQKIVGADLEEDLEKRINIFLKNVLTMPKVTVSTDGERYSPVPLISKDLEDEMNALKLDKKHIDSVCMEIDNISQYIDNIVANFSELLLTYESKRKELIDAYEKAINAFKQIYESYTVEEWMAAAGSRITKTDNYGVVYIIVKDSDLEYGKKYIVENIGNAFFGNFRDLFPIETKKEDDKGYPGILDVHSKLRYWYALFKCDQDALKTNIAVYKKMIDYANMKQKERSDRLIQEYFASYNSDKQLSEKFNLNLRAELYNSGREILDRYKRNETVNEEEIKYFSEALKFLMENSKEEEGLIQQHFDNYMERLCAPKSIWEAVQFLGGEISYKRLAEYSYSKQPSIFSKWADRSWRPLSGSNLNAMNDLILKKSQPVSGVQQEDYLSAGMANMESMYRELYAFYLNEKDTKRIFSLSLRDYTVLFEKENDMRRLCDNLAVSVYDLARLEKIESLYLMYRDIMYRIQDLRSRGRRAPVIFGVKIAGRDIRYLSDHSMLYSDDLEKGSIVISGIARPGGMPIEKIEVSIDNQNSWKTAAIELADVEKRFRFAFEPDQEKEYSIAIRSLDEAGNEILQAYPSIVKFDKRSYRSVINQILNNISKSLSDENTFMLMNNVSPFYRGNYDSLKDSIKNDFKYYNNINIRINILKMGIEGNELVVETNWTRTWRKIMQAMSERQTGRTQIIFTDDAGWKIVDIQGDRIFGMYDIGEVVDIGSGPNVLEGTETLESILDQAGSLSVEGILFAGNEVLNETWPVLTISDMANAGDYLQTTSAGGIRDMGIIPFSQVTEAPASGYEAAFTRLSGTQFIGHTLCVKTRTGTYAKIYVLGFTKTTISGSTKTRFRFQWAYQPNGSRQF